MAFSSTTKASTGNFEVTTETNTPPTGKYCSWHAVVTFCYC